MLKQRLLTALILVPAFLLILLALPPVVGFVVFTGMVLMGAWEWSAFLRPGKRAYRAAYVAATGCLMVVAWSFAGEAARLELLLFAGLLWWLVAFAWLVGWPSRVSSLAAGIAGICVLVPAWVALGKLHLSPGAGPQWVVFMLVMISIADVGAYFSGRAFGRLKLAPRVSPGKTWEGMLGGVVSALVIAAAGAFWFDVTLGPFLALCGAVILISVVGDLTESMFKRYAGLKDSGTLFPGHGGVLDRIDSVTAASPLFLLGLGWLGVAG